MAEALRLNLGAGNTEIEGFVPIDRKNGQEVFPLEGIEPESVDEIYASHVLEHFSHRQVHEVLLHWVSKLKRGGRLRVAVPDFGWVAEHYMKGEPINTQGYIMGGHVDEDDRHGAIFDAESLSEIFAHSGLERINRWAPFVEDCSRLPVSLNLEGYKPTTDDKKCKGVMACVSAPRFGPMMHMRDSYLALAKAGIPYQVGQGAYWHFVLSQMMEGMIEDGAEYILTMDYDTMFKAQDVLELYRLMKTYTQYDALVPVQMKRGRDFALFSMRDADGKPREHAYAAEFDRDVTRIDTGHFGLTLFRASALKKLPRPWFRSTPGTEGRWDDKKVDPDINFWIDWKEAGLAVGVANRVVVGHMENVVKWPGKNNEAVYQQLLDYGEEGIPPEVSR